MHENSPCRHGLGKGLGSAIAKVRGKKQAMVRAMGPGLWPELSLDR